MSILRFLSCLLSRLLLAARRECTVERARPPDTASGRRGEGDGVVASSSVSSATAASVLPSKSNVTMSVEVAEVAAVTSSSPSTASSSPTSSPVTRVPKVAAPLSAGSVLASVEVGTEAEEGSEGGWIERWRCYH